MPLVLGHCKDAVAPALSLDLAPIGCDVSDMTRRVIQIGLLLLACCACADGPVEEVDPERGGESRGIF